MRKLIALLILVAVPLSATDGNPSKKQRELVQELLKATKSDKTALAVMDSMLAEMQKQFLGEAEQKGNGAEDIAEAQANFERFRELAQKMDLGETINESLIRIYAKYFTEEELTALIAFYGSPVGAKTIDVMPRLMQDAMSLGAQQITPKLLEIGKQVEKEWEQKYPWRRTMRDMRSITTAVEAYATDQEDATYPRGDLAAALSPTYIKELPKTDVWGHEYAYVISPDAKHYRVVSAGADGIFEWDSRRITEVDEDAGPRLADRLEDDIIFADGICVQQPKVAEK